ncbi:MAG: toll/interleukin-1 receptor domain-containing protein, partial [Thermoactinomyces sp.]
MKDEHRFIFISYANKDEHKMEPIVEYLENRNLPCWVAPRNIPFGENFQTVIINDIKKADAVLVLITENIAEARFVQKEVERALAYNKFVIPVFVDNTSLPSSLEFFLCDLQ